MTEGLIREELPTTGDSDRANRRGGGRPRSASSRRAVLDAAFEILIQEGLAAFSVDAVASRSGVARSTIYRSWPTKGLLVFDSFLEAFERQLVFQHTEFPAGDFRRLVHSLAAVLSGPAGRLAASVVAEAQSDEEVRQLLVARFSEPLRNRAEQLLNAGVSEGIFRADVKMGCVLDAFVGAVYLRLLFGLPLEPAWAEALTDTLLLGCIFDAEPFVFGE